MIGGNPPDSFQVHGGMELIDTYVVTGKMEPLTAHLKEWGIYDKFPADIMEICSYKGEVYSIPVNVHRGDVLFINKEILDKVGISLVPANWPEFIEVLKKIKAAGYVPLSLGDKNKWTATHLFETILLSTMGPYNYNGLWNGRVNFSHQGVKDALNILLELMDYVNDDHAALTWQDATLMVFERKAAFNVMGDWAEGYLKTLGWTPGKEFNWMTVPGTKGAFMVVTDTFGLPKGAPHRENALKWLKIVASVEGQDAFNPIKGSIPARLDADKSLNIKGRTKEHLMAFFILLPTIILIGIFVYGFIGLTIRTSFSNWNSFSRLSSGIYKFVGLNNYLQLLSDPRFITDLWNTLFFTLFLFQVV
jgi:glucose/mannose transport system substrate-binding protein